MHAPTDAGPGRRERKKAATRDALFQAARDLVEERGFSAVTVDAIAERADVSTRTFFNHFASKEEAVLGWDPADAIDVTEEVRAGLAGGIGPLDALERALSSVSVSEAVTSSGLRRRLALLHDEPVLLATSFSHWEQLTDALIAAVSEVTPEGDPYPDVVVHVAVAALRAALRRWSLTGDGSHDRLRHDIAASFDALRAGLPAPARPTTDDLSPELIA